MKRFVRRENIRHLREMLERVTDETQRHQLQKLLDEELQKQKDAGDEPAQKAQGRG